MLLQNCRLRTLNHLLDLIWSQWTTLGVSGNAPVTQKWVLDPEALVLFTCNTGRYEPRAFDSMLEWLSINQRFLNVQRLKTIHRRENFEGKQLLAAIAHLLMKPSSKAKWKGFSDKIFLQPTKTESLFKLKDGNSYPLLEDSDVAFKNAGFIRHGFQNRNTVGHFRPDYPANLIMKLRALFGLNSRCEIIAYLYTHSEANPTEIASYTYYSPKAIYNAITDMEKSGALARRTKGRASLYSLETNTWETLLSPEGVSAEWMNWPTVFRTIEIIWTALDKLWIQNESTQTAENEMRLVIHEALTKLQQTIPNFTRNHREFSRIPTLDLQEMYTLIEEMIKFLS